MNMIHSYLPHSPIIFIPNHRSSSSNKSSMIKTLTTVNHFVSLQPLSSSATSSKYPSIRSESSPKLKDREQSAGKHNNVSVVSDSFCESRSCSCGRRRFIGASGAALLPISSSNASDLPSNSKFYVQDMLNRIHPPRADWYEEFYAVTIDKSMKLYEAEVAGYKAKLFTSLRGKANKVLELGIGTGPNLKYYASDASVHVFGVDPNKKMEKYAQTAAVAAGLPLSNFNFIQAVGEALPLSDASMDAVIGTLVLCSVKDVNMTLEEVKRVLKPGGLYLFVEHVAAQDGTALRFLQGVLDPLQQTVSDGCHLTRETGKDISEAGFSDLDINMAFFSTLSLIGPHVYGIACK
ncbi:hypothetical protein HHK36_015362 [Tetracentron sinense]|uniref:Methyltransferase type 11 domain-containing protein n=1 Tax=Tetracentron sinense TaxID=13715 RepID=A0A835DDT0_TETSI|nr:hypothetical protein HHK36_015362 [Tetracentron sinense]